MLTCVLVCVAKPGRVVGPVIPYESGAKNKDAYDGRGVYLQNAVLPPQTISPNYYFRTNAEKNQDKYGGGVEADRESSQTKSQHQQQQQQQYPLAKSNPAITTDMNQHHLYYQSHAKTVQLNGQIAIDAKLLQAQSQFGAIGAAAVAVAAHREVGTVQYGLT